MRAVRRLVVVTALVALPACAGPAEERSAVSGTPTPAASPTATPTGTPGATPTATPTGTPAAPSMPATISIGATSATVSFPFAVGASASSSAPHGAVSFSGNTGSLYLEGATLAAAVYERQIWDDFGYTLYQGLAIGASRWDVFWLYCQGSTLRYVWHEGAGGPAMHYVNANGTCSGTSAATSAAVSLPAMTLAVPPPVAGYTISGTGIGLADGATGFLRVGSKTLPFVPFEDVDCTACGTPGWYELHSLAWDEEEQRAIFVILYLDLAYPGRVFAAYARSLPDFGDPIGAVELAATWSAPPGSAFAPTAPTMPRLLPPGRSQ